MGTKSIFISCSFENKDVNKTNLKTVNQSENKRGENAPQHRYKAL